MTSTAIFHLVNLCLRLACLLLSLQLLIFRLELLDKLLPFLNLLLEFRGQLPALLVAKFGETFMCLIRAGEIVILDDEIR